ncbi:MAG: DUF2934 domain-containing protein [Limisphaerales bacterium]
MSAKTKSNPRAARIAVQPRPEPTHDDIALCAVSIWEEEGRPQGRELEHWLLAEARLRQGCNAEASAANGESSRRSGRSASKRSQPDSVVL